MKRSKYGKEQDRSSNQSSRDNLFRRAWQGLCHGWCTPSAPLSRLLIPELRLPKLLSLDSMNVKNWGIRILSTANVPSSGSPHGILSLPLLLPNDG